MAASCLMSSSGAPSVSMCLRTLHPRPAAIVSAWAASADTGMASRCERASHRRRWLEGVKTRQQSSSSSFHDICVSVCKNIPNIVQSCLKFPYLMSDVEVVEVKD